MAVDEMTARARRLAELEAAQHARQGDVQAAYNTLVTRARALGQPVPEPVVGQFDSVLTAREDAIDSRAGVIDAFGRTLTDWKQHLDRIEDELSALSSLRHRLTRLLSAEVSELSPNELSKLVARAIDDRSHTGPLTPLVTTGPSAGVEQEAQLLEHLFEDDEPEIEDGIASSAPVVRPRSSDLPFAPRAGTLRHGDAHLIAPSGSTPSEPTLDEPVAAAVDGDQTPEPKGTRNVEAARIDDYDALDALARVEVIPATPAPQPGSDPRWSTAFDHPSEADHSVSIDGDELECFDIEPGEDGLNDWLNEPGETVEGEREPEENEVDAEIDALDDDSLLEWEAAGLGNQVADLIERRRPPSARTSVLEVVEDPFAAFDDDFDDSLDAPFGFVDGSHSGEGPALVDEPQPASEDATPRAQDTAFDLGQDMDDPFDDSLSDFAGLDTPMPTRGTGPVLGDGSPIDTGDWDEDADASAPPDDSPSTDALIHGVDLGEAFATIAAPLGDEPATDDAGFDAALDAAFADAEHPARRTLDSVDLDMDSISGDMSGRPRDPRIAAAFGVEPRDPSMDSLEASLDAAFAEVERSVEPIAEPDAWAEIDSALDTHLSPTDDDTLGHRPAPPGVLLDAVEMAEDRVDHSASLSVSTVDGPAPSVEKPTPPAEAPDRPDPVPQSERFDLDAALDAAESVSTRADYDADADFPDSAALTSLDWPPPRPLDAFPDGSIELASRSETGQRAADPDPNTDLGSGISPISSALPFPAVLEPPEESMDIWRSTALGPPPEIEPSASLADALSVARRGPAGASGGVDAILDALEAPREDENARASARFAALAGGVEDDPWAALDIPDHSRGDTSPGLLPTLARRRRQGRVDIRRSRSRPLISGPVPAPAESAEEHAPRAPLAVRVGLEAGDRFFTGFSVDISVDGIFVESQHGLEVGRGVEVFFELPGGRAINVEGRVRRIRDATAERVAGLGIRFQRLTREDRVYIGRYVARTLTGKIPLP